MIRSIFSGLLLLAVMTVAAQEPIGEGEPNPFPPGIREAFSTLDRSLRPTADALADSVQGVWDGGGFTKSQKDTITRAVEKLLGGRSWRSFSIFIRAATQGRCLSAGMRPWPILCRPKPPAAQPNSCCDQNNSSWKTSCFSRVPYDGLCVAEAIPLTL